MEKLGNEPHRMFEFVCPKQQLVNPRWLPMPCVGRWVGVAGSSVVKVLGSWPFGLYYVHLELILVIEFK